MTTETIPRPNVTTYGENRSLTFNIAAGTTNFNTVVYIDHAFNNQTMTTETTRKSSVYTKWSA